MHDNHLRFHICKAWPGSPQCCKMCPPACLAMFRQCPAWLLHMVGALSACKEPLYSSELTFLSQLSHPGVPLHVSTCEVVVPQAGSTRQMCSAALLAFLLDYPLGPKRVEAHFNFLLSNLQVKVRHSRLWAC